MEFEDLPVERNEEEWKAVKTELLDLEANIRERCFCSDGHGIPGLDGDLLVKYSGEGDLLGLRSSDYMHIEYFEGFRHYILIYGMVGKDKEDTKPNPKAAFMLRDAIADFNPKLPVQVMIYNKNLWSGSNKIEFTIWPNKEKITRIHCHYYIEELDESQSHLEDLEGFDKF